jgi:uncharacterized protein DUF6516
MNALLDYFERVQALIYSLSPVEIERYDERVMSPERGNHRIRLRFSDNSLPEVSEAIHSVGGALVWLSYRHHYQKANGSVVFRYDNTPHHPEVSTHPEHKHGPDAVVSAVRPDIERIFEEVRVHIRQV